jgi:serine/threonine protein phosphatase PrpC
MHEAKNTARAIVKIGFDGRVHKYFKGPQARERFANEARVLRFLAAKGCDFVPRILEIDEQEKYLVITNCGSRVERLSNEKKNDLFSELESFGVRHEDAEVRNVTYDNRAGRFCLIDFEFATILEPGYPPSPKMISNPNRAEWANESNGNTSAISVPKFKLSSRQHQVSWSGMTHPGRFRKNNEDAFLALEMDANEVRYLGKVGVDSMAEKDFIFAVSDGMGGANAGEFASRIAVDRIAHLLPRSFRASAMGISVGFSDLLEQLFEEIHLRLRVLSSSYEECSGMGTALSLCWVRPQWVYFCHIGDTRIYHLPNSGGIRQVTQDHTHVGWLRRQGKINEREHRVHPHRNQLQQVLGGQAQYLNPHIGAIDYEPGDRFLICSDGLIEGHWDKALNDKLRNPPANEMRPSAQYLVETAISISGRDNATAIVFEILP